MTLKVIADDLAYANNLILNDNLVNYVIDDLQPNS